MSNAEKQEGWDAPKQDADLNPEALAEWQALVGKVRELATRFGWSKAEVARRADVAEGTFSQWYNGTYKGTIANVNDRVLRWLDSIEDGAATTALLPQAPGFVETPTSAKIRDALLYAQLSPEIVIITTAPGMGKTCTAKQLRDTRPHVHLVTMRPTTASVHGMLTEFCQVLDIPGRDPASRDRSIGDKLQRNGRQTLLVVDEAQHLKDDAVNQLRFFFDQFGVGIALLGNEAIYGRFRATKASPAYAQIERRIGKRLFLQKPTKGDIEAILAAWRIEDRAVLEIARAIGRKPGALGQITKTLQLAGMLAAGEGRPVAAADVRRAWQERGGEL